MRLRSVSSGWVRAVFFAILAILVFVVFHKLMARSRLALTGFTWTFLAIPAVSLIEELRRPAGQTDRFEEAPEDAPYESRTSPGQLAWPVGLLLWFFLPVAIVGTGVNVAIGLAVHNVAGAMGAMAAVAAGLLAGLAAWTALRTLTFWRLGNAHAHWPLWTAVPRPSISFRALREEWPRAGGTFYFRR